jgi:hypothetical protein
VTGYLSKAQVDKLLQPIHKDRVATLGKFSYLQAYDVRAAMTRVFGFGRWSADVLAMELAYETVEKDKPKLAWNDKTKRKEPSGEVYDAWTVCYRAQVRLTVCAPDGTVLATYTEWAAGESPNQPVRGDCHDMAMKTAESQALKRAATNLGDCFGLSLYNAGSRSRIVGRTLVPGEGGAQVEANVDEHITGPLAVEDAPPLSVEPAPEVREKSTRDPQPVKATVTELQENIARIQGRKP